MKQRLTVIGAASMGALRATELEFFGMVGIGRVFEAYKSEEITDDDEVAIIHGPAEAGYLSISDSMIDIRFCVDDLIAASAIDEHDKINLLKVAKAQSYPDRSIKKLVTQHLPENKKNAVIDWLETRHVSAKEMDAIEAIAFIRKILESDQSNKMQKQNYEFERTAFWDVMERSNFTAR